MSRLIIEHDGVRRVLANKTIGTHDGSINLFLIRAGSNTSGWRWDLTESDFDVVEYSQEMPKTQRISIHISGRVNYHGSPGPSVNFIPCLLDLTEAIPIFVYSVPTIDALDLASDIRVDDCVINIVGELEERLGFEFLVISSDLPPLAGEVYRSIVEGRYGLACVVFLGGSMASPEGVPAETFTFARPTSPLTHQSIPEEQAFLRFQKLMHENQIRQALRSSEIPEDLHDQLANEIVSAGRGIQGPNGEGVWEIVCNVPMRIGPALTVKFSDPRYRAEIIDMQPVDVRLERVRVRFRVFDTKARKWIKHSVEILEVFLDAEL